MPEAITNIYTNEHNYIRFGEKTTRLPNGETVKTPVLAPAHLFSYNGVENISMPRLMLIFSMKMALIYEDTVHLFLEDMSKSTALIETATLIAEKLSAVRHGQLIEVVKQTVPFKTPEGGTTQVPIYTYLTAPHYLGISDIIDPTIGGDTHWDFKDCADTLVKLNRKLDQLNSLNQEQIIDMQTALNSMNLSYKYGLNMGKMMLHGARNMANNLARV